MPSGSFPKAVITDRHSYIMYEYFNLKRRTPSIGDIVFGIERNHYIDQSI